MSEPLPILGPDGGGTTPDGRPAEAQPRWRQDFPIDQPQYDYISRRDLVKFLILVSASFTAGQTGLLPGLVQMSQQLLRAVIDRRAINPFPVAKNAPAMGIGGMEEAAVGDTGTHAGRRRNRHRRGIGDQQVDAQLFKQATPGKKLCTQCVRGVTAGFEPEHVCQ